MKNYDERIESIFRKYDEKLEDKRRKSAAIRRIAFSTSGLCAAVIVAVLAIKIPNRTGFNPSDIVVTPTSSVEVTTTTVLPQTTEQSNTTFTTTFANSKTKTTETVTNVTTVSNRTEQTTSNNASTTATTKHINPATTVVDTTKTTTHKITETTVTSTVTVTLTSTTTQVVTTTDPRAAATNPNGGDKPPNAYDPWYDLPIYKQFYNAFLDGYVADLTPIYRGGYPISGEFIGERISGAKMKSQTVVDGEIPQCQAEAFYIKDFSDEMVIAIKFKYNDVYYLYHTDKTDLNSLTKLIPPLET